MEINEDTTIFVEKGENSNIYNVEIANHLSRKKVADMKIQKITDKRFQVKDVRIYSYEKQEQELSMEDKIEKLLEILKDMTLEQWNQIKNEIDIIYRDVEYKKVPNSQLETLKARLLCKKEVGLVFSSNPKN